MRFHGWIQILLVEVKIYMGKCWVYKRIHLHFFHQNKCMLYIYGVIRGDQKLYKQLPFCMPVMRVNAIASNAIKLLCLLAYIQHGAHQRGTQKNTTHPTSKSHVVGRMHFFGGVVCVFWFTGNNIENLDKSAKFNIAKCPKCNLASAAKLTYNLASKFFKLHAKCCKRIASPLSTCKHHRSSKYYSSTTLYYKVLLQ